MRLSNDHPEGCSDFHFARFQKERVLERLRALDARARREGLDSLDPSQDPLISVGMEIGAQGGVTKNSYGVFDLSWQAQQHPEWPGVVAGELEDIRGGIQAAHKLPLRFLIWAGMGGSAEDKLAYQAAGLLKRGPRCYVLDSADPGKLKYILEDMQKRSRLPLADLLRSTLVVGMAMGMTSFEPVVNLEKLHALYQTHRIDSQPNFLYMTLPGSLLDQFGRQQGYRRVELQLDNGNTTAGRHSGPLTRGSLYPLGLARMDLRAWMEATFLTGQDISAAWRLAAFIHAQGEGGRDKLTLLLPKAWAGAALWTKQDFEESLGKREDLGLKIVIGEKPKLANYRSRRDPRQDRAFLAVEIKGSPEGAARKIALLRRAGYPLAALTFPRGACLATYMQFVHYVVFGVAYLRQMNFVTQPSVELYKTIAGRLYAESQKAGGVRQTRAWQGMVNSPQQARWRGCVTLYYNQLCPAVEAGQRDAPRLYAGILKQLAEERKIEYGELTFFGDTRYSPGGRALLKKLGRAAGELFRERLKMPADVHEGPAMNHSYHEMIIGHGRCFSTVLVSEKQEQLPAVRYSPDYHLCQFLATQMALGEKSRPVVAITVKDLEESTLARLEEFFHQAATALKSAKV